jgi:arabinosaccharide transport system substrate-binding protein
MSTVSARALKISRRNALGVLGGACAGIFVGSAKPTAMQTKHFSETSVQAAANPSSPTLSGTGANKVELVCWTEEGFVTEHFERMAKIYTDKNPGVELKISGASFPVGDIAQKAFATFNTGSGAPDLLAIHFNDMAKYLKSGQADRSLIELTPLLSSQEQKDLVFTEYWNWQGKLYGIPLNNTMGVFHYYKPAFDDAGVDPAAFKTWDDFIKAGLALKKKNKFITVADVSGWNQWIILAGQNGGGFFDKNGKVLIDSEGSVQALELWVNLIKNDRVAWGTSQFYGPGVIAAYKDTTVVGVIIPEWYVQVLKPSLPEQAGKWRIAPLPRSRAGGPRTALRGGTCITVTKQSKNQDIAWKFVHWTRVTHEGAVASFQDQLKDSVFPPTYLPAARDKAFTEYRNAYYGDQPIGQILSDLSHEVPPIYCSPHQDEAWDIVNRGVFAKMMQGQGTPREALKAAADKVRALS